MMKRYSFFLLCVMLGLLSATAAEPGVLRGQVKDCVTGEPVSGVIVKIKGGFAKSDREGRFMLKLNTAVDSVSFRGIGYEQLVLPVDADLREVCLNPKETRLNDVIVEAPDIYARGDTLVFNVSRYAKATDNAIIDVIKRLPGIKVKDDGTIEYQGKPINKFYLDGNDFIGGQYGLATNNISHKDVKSVEVMENHQPVKALEGIEFPEEAGINLTLKEDARSRWVGVAQGAVGVQPLLFDASLFTMRMASKAQNMFTLKADNTGWNPANEIREHDFDDMFSSDYVESLWPEYISADRVSAPLSEKRTRDNLSWLANGITAWKRGDNSMRLKLNYMADRLDYRSGLTTDYFSLQIPTFVQRNSQRIQTHDLSAQLYSETNKRGYYLKDKLILKGVLGMSNSAITGSFDLLQRVRRRNLSAVNDLKLVKRNDKRLFTLISHNSFGWRPDRLTANYDEETGDAVLQRSAVQSVDGTDLRSTTETRFGWLTRFWKYYLTAGVDLDYHRMNSVLSGLENFDNDGMHDAFQSNLYATPQVDFERNGWRLSMYLSLKWRHYSVGGQYDYLNLSPRFYVRRQLTAKSELSGSISYRLGSPQAYRNINVPILSDYRTLFIAERSDRYSNDVSANVTYRYRNPIKSLFFNLSGGYNYSRSSLMSNQIFLDDFIISTYADRLHHTGTWHLKGDFSKGLGHSKMVTGVEATISGSSASSMRDAKVIPYQGLSAGVKPYFKGSLLRWLSVNYDGEYTFSCLDIEGEVNNYNTLHQNLFASVIPTDAVSLTFGGEHFLTCFPEGNTANLLLLDASAAWKVTGRLRLSLTANNLLNRRWYEYATYGTLSRSEHSFRLRPRSILLSLQYRF